jgi:hypothetical protein
VRPRDPRRLLERRRRALARVNILKVPQPGHGLDGSIGSKHVAEVTLPRAELERIWSPEYLERLGRTYWRFLMRFSFGLLRVLYTTTARDVVLLTRPIVLLRFRAPRYEAEPDSGTVTWAIDRGLLVARAGRGRGYLRLSVCRAPEGDGAAGQVKVTVSSEVVHFYPALAGRGWFRRIGRVIYNLTQMRLHGLVTHAFLRSLANLDLAPSVVGALAPPERSATPAARR